MIIIQRSSTEFLMLVKCSVFRFSRRLSSASSRTLSSKSGIAHHFMMSMARANSSGNDGAGTRST